MLPTSMARDDKERGAYDTVREDGRASDEESGGVWYRLPSQLGWMEKDLKPMLLPFLAAVFTLGIFIAGFWMGRAGLPVPASIPITKIDTW